MLAISSFLLLQLPHYKNHCKTYVIWGLTAMITVNFLNLALEAGIDLKKPEEILGEKCLRTLNISKMLNAHTVLNCAKIE